MNLLDSMQEAATVMLKTMGLGEFKVSLHLKPMSFDRDIVLGLDKIIEKTESVKELMLQFEPLAESILDSEMVRHRVKDPLEKIIVELEQKCKELEELKPYKEHFDIEMKLRHGVHPIFLGKET